MYPTALVHYILPISSRLLVFIRSHLAAGGKNVKCNQKPVIASFHDHLQKQENTTALNIDQQPT
jgi:hypothetical protein